MVPRKEFLETFAAAAFIHRKFPHIRRIADLAAGHGLLSWFLLALDPSRTAICVDRRMPPSADVIAAAMVQRFPELKERWSYVQGDLSSLVCHSSTLLVSVHACGTLSDLLVDMAISSGSSLAIVPCCHTVQVEKGYRPHVLSGMDAEDVVALVASQKNETTTIGDIVDGVRCRALERAGYEIEEVMIPEVFTKRNRLLLGVAAGAGMGTGMDDCNLNRGGEQHYTSTSTSTSRVVTKKQTMFFEREKESETKNHMDLVIPIGDDPESIAYCHSIGGRAQATARMLQQIPKHFSPTLNLSIWLVPSDDENALPLNVQSLQTLATRCSDTYVKEAIGVKEESVQCIVQPLGDVSTHSETGRRSQTFKVEYKAPEGSDISSAAISRDTAKGIHHLFRERIVAELGHAIR